MIRRAATSLVLVAVVVGASTTHPATASASAIRNAYLQPFTSTSIWNQPVGTGAVYVPAQIAPPTVRSLTADETVTLMDPSAPLTPIALNGGQHSDRCGGGAAVTTAPIPPAFVLPSSTSNNGYAVVGSDGSTLTEGGAFARCSPGAAATAASAKAFGSIYGDGLTGGAGGSGLSTLGGLLRVNELVPGGQIHHAVRVNLDGASDLFPGPGGFRWPATHEDGYGPTYYGGHTPALKMGALLALPANLNLASLGITSGPGMILAQALQDYGAYVSNDTKRPVFSIDTETGDASMINQFQSAWGYPFETAGVGGSPWANDVMTILNNLSVVDNNSAASIGGGGTPLVPLAPPLAVGAQPSASIPAHFAPSGVGAPQVAVTPDGSTQLVFWRGANNQLAEAWYTGTWNGPISFPQLGTLTSTPAVAVSKDGKTQLVFWQGPAGHLFEAWYTGTWNGPVDITDSYLGGRAILASAPSVVTTRDGSQLVFWRGTDGHLGEAWYASGAWHGPADFSHLGSLASAPSATVTADGSTQLVFFQGTDGRLTEDWFTGVWNGPMRFGAIVSQPTVAVTPDGSTQLVFYKGSTGHLLESWYTVGGWHGPVDWTVGAFGGAAILPSSPSATVTVDGSTQLVFWQGAGSTLWEGWYTRGAWHGPVNWSG
jgi:hypothetical protein